MTAKNRGNGNRAAGAALLRAPFPGDGEVLAQEAEEVAGLAQLGVEVGKFAFLAGDEFVVEHQPQHGLVNFIGQLVQRLGVAVLHEELHGLGLEKGGFGTGVGGGGSGHTHVVLDVRVRWFRIRESHLTLTNISKILVI